MRRLWLTGLAAAIGTFTFSGCIRHTVHAQVLVTSHVVSSTFHETAWAGSQTLPPGLSSPSTVC